MFAGYDEHYGFQLYQSDPSGNYSGWKATVIGANNQAGKSLLKNEYGVKKNKYKIIVLDNGIGDHLTFLSIFPQIKEKYKDHKIILAVCYPEVFKDETDIKLVSIGEIKDYLIHRGVNIDKYNIYKLGMDLNWKRPLEELFLEMYV